MKITDEIKIQINELYLELGVKKRVAEIVGCSPSTVSKYIIEGYVSQKDKEELPPFDESKITGPRHYKDWAEFFSDCILTADEKAEMKEIQKEVMI
jgi:transposase-like protein